MSYNVEILINEFPVINDDCPICFDPFYKSFGKLVNSFVTHPTTVNKNSNFHIIHYQCLIEIFKNSIRKNIAPTCPTCQAASNIEDIIRISKYTIFRFRSTSETPNARIQECPYLSPGYVSDKDLEFARTIQYHESRKAKEGILPLIKAIVDYTKDLI